MRKLPRFFPEHRPNKLIGVLAALEFPGGPVDQGPEGESLPGDDQDDVFEIVPPDDFVLRTFGLRGLG